jgi:F-type H+-transporting ATPase subunit b
MTLPFQISLFLLEAHAETGSLLDRIIHSNLINILLIVALLLWVAKKQNIPAALNSQREKIAGEIMQAQHQKQEAEAKLAEVQRKTANLKKDVEEILSTAHSSAESLANQIIANAQAEATAIVDNAKKRVELEQRSAMKSLQARLLDEAIQDAQVELSSSMSDADRAQSVEDFIVSLTPVGGAR